MPVKDFLNRSQAILDTFGNHTKRYRYQVEQYHSLLVEEYSQRTMEYEEYFFNLWSETEYQLMLLEQLADTERDKVNLISLFFAFHYLKLNIEVVSLLRRDFDDNIDTSYSIYQKALLYVRQRFFSLSRAIMNRLSYYSGMGRQNTRFVIFNVGSLVDHDDLDVGLVYDNVGPSEPGELDKYVSRLSQKFFKIVTHLHFHLSEALSLNHYGASIGQYIQYLNAHLDDVVVISQLLGASRLCGDMEMFYSFKASIVERYFRGAAKYKQQYIENATRELESFCSQPISSTVIHPKQEVYRVIALLVSALRIAHQIHRGNIWETIDQLCRVNPENGVHYRVIKDAYAFVQMFRYLFYLFVCQRDTIMLEEESEVPSLERIARLLGLSNRFELMKDYQYIASSARRAVKDVSAWLRRTYLIR